MSNQRLLAPRIDEVETKLGGKLPTSIKRLYAQRDVVTKENVRFADPGGEERLVLAFLPLDVAMLSEVWPDAWKRECPFADAGDGDYYFVKLGDRAADDGPVHIFYHDGGDRELVTDSVEQFVKSISG